MVNTQRQYSMIKRKNLADCREGECSSKRGRDEKYTKI